MNDFYRILEAIQSTTQPSALATIIQVEGSAYRKAGTSMLFCQDGTRVGLISGGCLEEDLAHRVLDVIDSQIPQTVVYDMKSEDDLSWGQGAGCNGRIHVLVQPLTTPLKNRLQQVLDHLTQGRTVFWLQRLDAASDSKEKYVFVTEDGSVIGDHDAAVPNNIKAVLQELKHGETAKTFYIKGLNIFVYAQVLRPRQRVVIFGAGSDAQPLVLYASHAGFHVTVADWRPALCNLEMLPHAHATVVGCPRDVINQLHLGENDSVIVMTHSFQRDREILGILANQTLAYVGVLGSRNRTKRLLGQEEIPSWIQSPLGLSIGAQGPEEIAISALAQVIQAVRTVSSTSRRVINA